jgi:hypothetical protein
MLLARAPVEIYVITIQFGVIEQGPSHSCAARVAPKQVPVAENFFIYKYGLSSPL